MGHRGRREGKEGLVALNRISWHSAGMLAEPIRVQLAHESYYGTLSRKLRQIDMATFTAARIRDAVPGVAGKLGYDTEL